MVGGVDPVHGAALLDAYGSMLTDRQREACALVFDEDWSLAEAADALAISRARVGALVTDAMHRLQEWEARLRLVERQTMRRKLQEELRQLASRGATTSELLEFIQRWEKVEELDAHV